MTNNSPTGSKGGPVSVSTMADWVNLSRDRFYDLVRSGVFPPPVYDLVTRQPRYTVELQEICLRIRETGVGFDGQLVLFNRKRRKGAPRQSRPSPSGRLEGRSDQVRIWTAQLRHLGIKVTRDEVSAALEKFLPQGTLDAEDGEVLRRLCRQLRGSSG